MADVIRLTLEQKIALGEWRNHLGDDYDSNSSKNLENEVQEAMDKLDGYSRGNEYVLISKTEVHPQVWNALKNANSYTGSIDEAFDNGDEDPKYHQAMKVEKNVFEALLELLVVAIQGQINKLSGKGSGHGDDRSPQASRKPRTGEQDAYEP